MQITSPTQVTVELGRQGGSIIAARLDFWLPAPGGWQLAASSVLQKVTAAVERQTIKLAKGDYTAVFTCRVEESINGIYGFAFSVGGTAVYADKGNVNTTPHPHDAKVYKDQFVLTVV